MKKRLLLPLLFAGLWATPALATPYVSVSAGLGLLNDSDMKVLGVTVDNMFGYSAGIPVDVAVGIKSGNCRLEGAVGYQSYNINAELGVPVDTNVDVSAWSFMANGYYDFTVNNSGVSPYLTAGLGFASVNGSENSVDIFDDTVFAWQAGAGLGIKVSENVIVDLSYRYFKTADVAVVDLGGYGTADLTISGSRILAGIRYSF